MVHDVTFEIPERRLGKVDIEFKVKRDGALLGTLKISKGAIAWRLRNGQRDLKLSWAKFDEYMRLRDRRR
jgi:hypothetical protein